MKPGLVLAVAVGLAAAGACRPGRDDGQVPTTTVGPDASSQPSEEVEEPEQAPPTDDPAHHVVFADRTSQGYLLLYRDKGTLVTPTREELVALVRKRLSKAEPEVDVLIDLIGIEPQIERRDPTAKLDQEALLRASREARDLLGFYVETFEFDSGGGELISAEALVDPVLTRELEPRERESLAARNRALLLRADYRNQHGVRGLRLLQTLVRIVASERDAVIHDPDTGETLGLAAFTRRRLQSKLGNVADQIAVVPFSDPLHGEGHVRLTTRGMRRFGSVDLELDGLPPDPTLLQQATHLINGLALQMVRLGEVDPSGFAVEVGDTVEIQYRDVKEAYATRGVDVRRCGRCPERVQVHLVERQREDHDPPDHVVARIVAPRSTSAKPGYDHPRWARQAIQHLLGPG